MFSDTVVQNEIIAVVLNFSFGTVEQAIPLWATTYRSLILLSPVPEADRFT